MSTADGPVYDAATVARLLKIEYSQDELESFGPLPKGLPGFVTFFDPGWSITDVDRVIGNPMLYHGREPYRWERFAKATEDPRYRQLRMEPPKCSFRKSFAEQEKCLLPDEEVASARVMCVAMCVHFLASGERLFPRCHVRCIDVGLHGERIMVGIFKEMDTMHGMHRQISVWGDSDSWSTPCIGLAVCRELC